MERKVIKMIPTGKILISSKDSILPNLKGIECRFIMECGHEFIFGTTGYCPRTLECEQCIENLKDKI